MSLKAIDLFGMLFNIKEWIFTLNEQTRLAN